MLSPTFLDTIDFPRKFPDCLRGGVWGGETVLISL